MSFEQPPVSPEKSGEGGEAKKQPEAIGKPGSEEAEKGRKEIVLGRMEGEEKSPEQKAKADLDAIKKIAEQRREDRMKGEGLSFEDADKMLREQGLAPFTPEADRFMRDNDLKFAKEEHEKQEAAKRAKEIEGKGLEIAAALQGENPERSKKENEGKYAGFVLEALKGLDISKFDMEAFVSHLLDKMPKEIFPGATEMKEKKPEQFKAMVKEISGACRTDNPAERQKKVKEILTKYEIIGKAGEFVSASVEELARLRKQLEEKMKTGQVSAGDKAVLRQTLEAKKAEGSKIWEFIKSIPLIIAGLFLVGVVFAILIEVASLHALGKKMTSKK